MVPEAIGRLTLYTPSTVGFSGHVKVVEPSGLPHSMTCAPAVSSGVARDLPTAIERMIPRGEYRGRSPAGRSCSVVVEDAQPREVTPDMNDDTRRWLGTQEVRRVVRIREAGSDGTVSSTYFAPTLDVMSMIKSAQPAVLRVDSDDYTPMSPAAIARRSLLVEPAAGASPGHRVTIGFPANPEVAPAICDTN